MSQGNDISIRKAKGRPMLTWVGKKPLTRVKAFPAQRVERFAIDSNRGGLAQNAEEKQEIWRDWPDQYEQGGLLFHGDNKDVLAHLLANGFRGKIKLIYIDPPFDSGADYVRKVQLRGELGGSQKLDGEEYTLGEQIQYTDIWANDNYLQFMYERLLMLKELLAESGVIYVHLNHARVHLIRCVLDEVFGADRFLNDIVWRRGPGKAHPQYFGRVKDTILFYSKSDEYTWNKLFGPISDSYRSSFNKRDNNGYYVTQPLHSGKPAKNVPKWKGVRPPDGRGWAYKISTLDEYEAQGRIEWSEENVPRLKRYLNEVAGAPVQDVWDDISPVLDRSADHTSYPTQKPVELIERMISASTAPRDIFLDGFVGSGTSAIAAQKLGRRWIGCDINKGAIQTTAKRLQAIIAEQAEAESQPQQKNLVEDKSDQSSAPCQFGFSTWRVNDYDLQIQHNEAVNLACEYIGVTRNRADSYFDGLHGTRLVKIVPFNHPLTPLDLEDLKEELARRPDEERDIELVCLGMELAAQAAVEEHNRNRSRGPNRVHVIELRTDDKYGGFIQHEPLTAHIHAERKDDGLHVEVTDVLSPTIVKRLNMEEGLFKAQIDDWRAVVDAVMIDTSHDGKVFNIALSDVPEKKNDLVDGHYVLEAPPDGTTIAVKIIDRLGEEVLVTHTV